ncbi:leucyl aminopeptidase [Mycena polygramma]|nr:leucyl aminopeptidase [Mycena polygramma]
MATLTDIEDSEYRLPTDVSPSHYDLVVLTDLEALKFMGTVEIDLVIHNPTSRIVVNVADLDLHDILLSLEDGQTLIPFSEAYDKLSERVTLIFPVALSAGSSARLFAAFTGYSPAAWRAFPAFDEPALEATFSISLVARSDTVSLSNMPQYSEEPCDPSEMFNNMFQLPEEEEIDDDDDAGFAWKVTRFETTPIMSTYLVAYANGHFQHLESAFCSPLSARTVPLRIYKGNLAATPKNLPHAGFALELTARVLPLYEKIFDIEYPLPKLDTLVVDDFDAWLITGRASGYLLTNSSMLRLRKEIVALQSHEVAHMWFGNITTMSWWTYLYLNEGRLKTTSQFGFQTIADQIPVDWRSHHFSSYHLTDKYLTGYRYSSVRNYGCVDLKIDNRFCIQPGFPVVTAQETNEGVHLRQDRFLLAAGKKSEATACCVARTRAVYRAGYKQDVQTKCRYHWILVLYSSERLKAIGVEAAKETTVFSVADRVGLINDAIALAKADLLKMSDALSSIYALRSEQEYPVWMAIASNLATLVSIWWEDERIVELLNAFRRALFSPLVRRLGYNSNPEASSNESLLRTCAITQALDAGDTNVANELKGRFTHFLSTADDSKIPPELVTATYTARSSSRQGGEAWSATGIRGQALCAADDVELINETLAFVLLEVRDQDIMYFIGGLAENIKTRRRGAKFFMDNLDEMHERFKDGFGMADLLQLAFSSLSTEGDRNELVTFFKDKDTSKFELPLSQVLDSIEGNSACVMVRASVGFMAYHVQPAPALYGKSPYMVGGLEPRR